MGKGKESKWLGTGHQAFFHLLPNPGLDWSNPSSKEAAVHPASLTGSMWRKVSAWSFLPHPGSCPWPRALSSRVSRALPVPAAAGISQPLSLCLHQPGGDTAKILAVSAALRLCLRSHFCSCACLHLILFALTSMQMQQQAQAVRCSLYYYGFFSLQSLLAS